MPRSLDRCHNIADLRRLAKRRVPAPMFEYIDGAAEDEGTMRRNTAAFDEVDLVPRYLVDVAETDLSTTVLGAEVEWPVLLAPTGMSRLFHWRGEIAVARAAHRAGTLYSLSTLSSHTIEDVGAETPGPKMFQIYVLRDPELNESFLERCRQSGYGAMCLTVDVPVQGNRERDLRTGMTIPPSFGPAQYLDVLRHPAWVWNYLTKPPLRLANVADRIAQGSSNVSTLAKYIHNQFDPSVTWERAARMIERWDGPFAIKGILSADDARRAVEVGATAVIVSNHGGRQLDGAPATIDCLPEIAAAVGGRAEVILDGGIRRGSHVVKALALGADACMIGRAYLYGLGAGGEAGVDRALGILRRETRRALQLTGCTRLDQLDGRFVRRRTPAPVTG